MSTLNLTSIRQNLPGNSKNFLRIELYNYLRYTYEHCWYCGKVAPDGRKRRINMRDYLEKYLCSALCKSLYVRQMKGKARKGRRTI